MNGRNRMKIVRYQDGPFIKWGVVEKEVIRGIDAEKSRNERVCHVPLYSEKVHLVLSDVILSTLRSEIFSI